MSLRMAVGVFDVNHVSLSASRSSLRSLIMSWISGTLLAAEKQFRQPNFIDRESADWCITWFLGPGFSSTSPAANNSTAKSAARNDLLGRGRNGMESLDHDQS